MNIRYPAAFVEQALVKTYNREGRSIMSVADDLGVNVHTLRYWMKNRTGIDRIVPAKSAERRPQDWIAEEQLSALNETYGLTGEALQTWCREKGIYVHHLASWKTAFCAVSKESVPSGRELRDLKDENVKLKRDVARKDKALAEAAALLILQKKFRALWDEEGQMTSVPERDQIMVLVAAAIVSSARQAQACEAISLSERTLQRWQGDQARAVGDLRPSRIQMPKNKLTTLERQRILTVANSDEFGHLSPSQIVPRLADQGQFVGSESSFYRVLKDAKQLQHRTASKPSKPRHKPRALSATAPGQIYCWDITYLPSCIQGMYFYLYLFIDLYSRKIVGWQVYDVESSERASEVIRDICERENIAHGQVTLHSDNGSPMKGVTMRAMLEQLGVMPSFSRPAVSNDNPFSEALFKTLKYQSSYPRHPFQDLAAARKWVNTFVNWYNFEHRHSAIKFVTPVQRHEGIDTALLENRVNVYEAAKARNPERWSGKIRNWKPVLVVHLNPEKPLQTEINQPLETDPQIKKAA